MNSIEVYEREITLVNVVSFFSVQVDWYKVSPKYIVCAPGARYFLRCSCSNDSSISMKKCVWISSKNKRLKIYGELEQVSFKSRRNHKGVKGIIHYYQLLQINICDFTLFPDNAAFHSTYHLYENQTMKRLSKQDVLEIHFIELKKFIKAWYENNLDPLEDIFSWVVIITWYGGCKETKSL